MSGLFTRINTQQPEKTHNNHRLFDSLTASRLVHSLKPLRVYWSGEPSVFRRLTLLLLLYLNDMCFTKIIWEIHMRRKSHTIVMLRQKFLHPQLSSVGQHSCWHWPPFTLSGKISYHILPNLEFGVARSRWNLVAVRQHNFRAIRSVYIESRILRRLKIWYLITRK